MNKYLQIPFRYVDTEGNKCLVTLFMPVSFIDRGDLKDWKLEPGNFLGINFKAIIDNIDKEKSEQDLL